MHVADILSRNAIRCHVIRNSASTYNDASSISHNGEIYSLVGTLGSNVEGTSHALLLYIYMLHILYCAYQSILDGSRYYRLRTHIYEKGKKRQD